MYYLQSSRRLLDANISCTHKLPTPTQTPELPEAMYWRRRRLNTGSGGWSPQTCGPASSSLPSRVVFSRSLNLLSLSFHICTVGIRQILPQDPCKELRRWCLPHRLLASRQSRRSSGFGPWPLNFSPEAALGPETVEPSSVVPEHLASPNSNGSGKEALGVWHPSSGAAGAQGFRPGSKEVPATAPHTHPRGLGGREGAGASRAPSDGEMWPFTFTLQCQPLNHCLSARAQGCSRRRPPTEPPPPPRTRAQSPAQPRRPGRDGSRPRLLRPLCLPLSCCLCLSQFLSQGLISGTRQPQGPGPNSPRTSSSLFYGRRRE